MTDIERLTQIGETVREVLESIADGSSLLWSDDLAGACAVGAHAVFRLARKAGFECHFVMGEGDNCGHCWTEVTVGGEVYVVDTTATQFGAHNPRVLVLPRSSYYRLRWVHAMPQRHTDLTALRRLRHWPEYQQPKTYRRWLAPGSLNADVA